MPVTVSVHQGPVPAWLDRLIAATVAGAGVATVVVLWPVHPDARGYNTHVQLGLTPCSWPLTHGAPCPTCGVTTAACHVLHGHLLQAVAVQPFGALLALGGLLAAAFCLWALFRSRSVMDLVARGPYGTVVTGGIALLLLSWLYKDLTFTPP